MAKYSGVWPSSTGRLAQASKLLASGAPEQLERLAAEAQLDLVPKPDSLRATVIGFRIDSQ